MKTFTPRLHPILVFLFLFSGLFVHAGPQLLADINSAGDSMAGFRSFNSKAAAVDGYYFFSASESIHGFEPRVIDTTTGEEEILTDIFPGPSSSSPNHFVASGNQVFFTAYDPEAGWELWVSDGTPTGTRRVQDHFQGGMGANPSSLLPFGTTSVMYAAFDPDGGVELWLSDGTDAGTYRVADINSGEWSSAPSNLVLLEGWVYFSADDGVHGRELWRSNGTTTNRVADIAPGTASSSPSGILSNGGQIMFSACTADRGCELWRSKGTSDTTTPYGEINPGPADSSPENLIWNPTLGLLFFSADDGVKGRELWSLEPDSESLNRLSDINPGSSSSSPRSFLVLGSKVLFTASDGQAGTKLFSSDGNGTSLVKVLSSYGVSAWIDLIMEYDGRAYLIQSSACWYSDGTTSGTVRWTTECTRRPGLLETSGRLFLGKGSINTPTEIWSTSRDEADLVQLTYTASYSSDPDSFTTLGSSVLFAADDAVNGRELWIFDKTGAIKGVDLLSGAGSSNPDELTPFKGEIWFTVSESDFGRQLWHTDGTPDGTLALDPAPGASGISPRELRVVGSSLFFVGFDDSLGNQVFRTDGTVAGTVMLGGGGTYSMPQNLTAMGNTLFFFAQSPAAGRELWAIDASQTMPSMLEAIPGSFGASGYQLVVWDGFVYFVVNDGVSGDQLWRSNGSSPTPVTSLVPASGSSLIDQPTAGPDGVYFIFDDHGDYGSEIWKTDGATTVRVTDIAPGPDGSYANSLVEAGGKVFFVANNDASGTELWWTDGGMLRQTEIIPGPDGSLISGLVSVGDRILFSAYSPEQGRELWQSNGALTRRLIDLWPGVGSSEPREMARSEDGSWAYFSAFTEATWREPFRLGLSFFAHGFETGDLSGWSSQSP